MSVLKRGNSKNWYIQFQFKGKTYVKSSQTTDKRIAERMEREWKVKIHSQVILDNRHQRHLLKAKNYRLLSDRALNQ